VCIGYTCVGARAEVSCLYSTVDPFQPQDSGDGSECGVYSFGGFLHVGEWLFMEDCIGYRTRFCCIRTKIRSPSLTFFVRTLKVWNHDLFLTDDFLGQVVIPLKEVPVQEWNEKGDEARTGLVLRYRLLVLTTLRGFHCLCWRTSTQSYIPVILTRYSVVE